MKDFLDELESELKNQPDISELKLSKFEQEKEEMLPRQEETFEEEDNVPDENVSLDFVIPEQKAGPRIHPLARFPETKFYLPTLRDGYTRVIPI